MCGPLFAVLLATAAVGPASAEAPRPGCVVRDKNVELEGVTVRPEREAQFVVGVTRVSAALHPSTVARTPARLEVEGALAFVGQVAPQELPARRSPGVAGVLRLENRFVSVTNLVAEGDGGQATLSFAQAVVVERAPLSCQTLGLGAATLDVAITATVKGPAFRSRAEPSHHRACPCQGRHRPDVPGQPTPLQKIAHRGRASAGLGLFFPTAASSRAGRLWRTSSLRLPGAGRIR